MTQIPPGQRTVTIEAPERYAETVRGFVRWLGAPVRGRLYYDKRGEAIKATLELHATPERVGDMV